MMAGSCLYLINPHLFSGIFYICEKNMSRNIIKWFAFCILILLSTFFFIPSVVGIFTMEYLFSIISFLIFCLCVGGAIKVYKIKITPIQKKEKKKERKEKIITVEEKHSPLVVDVGHIFENQNQNKPMSPNLDFFLHNQVQRQGIQMLESLEVISETINIDTLEGRIEFVNSLYPNFIEIKNQPQYRRYVQKAIDEYKSMYYNKILSALQVSLLLNPDIIHLERYYGNFIYKSFKGYVERQQLEISKLKMESAKKRRYEKIIKTGYSAKYLFKKFDIPDYENNLEKIEEIRKQFYNI